MTFVDLAIGASAVCYLAAAGGLAWRGDWLYAGAFCCWAGANMFLILLAGGKA